jgi:hypothetical protein
LEVRCGSGQTEPDLDPAKMNRIPQILNIYTTLTVTILSYSGIHVCIKGLKR